MTIYESIPGIAEWLGCVPDDVILVLVWGVVLVLVLFGFSVFVLFDVGVLLYRCLKRFVVFVLTAVKRKEP